MPQAAKAKWNGERQAPRAAMQLRSPCKFTGAADTNTVPFSMTARTGDPIEHWYWGRCVHDLAGMTVAKPTLPVDWCHDPNEAMGFANSFDVKTGDLIVGGELVPMPNDEDDRATEVIYKQKLGVPYEASIDFSDGSPVIEYVPQGASVQVNGKAFEGPGVVFRQWMLRSVAICLYGADSDTSTEFAAAEMVNLHTVEKGETKMSATATPAETIKQAETPAAAADAAKLAGTPDKAAITPVTPASSPATIKPEQKFIDAFGDAGARWYLEGKSFETSAAEFIGKLKSDHAAALTEAGNKASGEIAALKTQLDAANQKLAALPRGDNGVTFANAEGAAAGQVKPVQGLTEGIARFAAGIKLPGQKK